MAEEGFRLFDAHVPVLQLFILLERAVQQDLEVGGFQRLQDENLATGKQGSDDLEGRILRRGADQHDGAALHGAEERILLRLVEAVDLVDKEDGSGGAGEEGFVLGLVDDFPDFLDTRADGAEGVELPVQGVGDDTGQGGLADAGRPPEDEGGQDTALDHPPKDAAFADQVTLADVLLQGDGAHPLRKGSETGYGCTYGIHHFFLSFKDTIYYRNC